MPVNVRCADCGKQYRIRDELAGTWLPCKACGTEFKVPAIRGNNPESAAPARGDGARRSRYASSNQGADDFDDDDFAGNSRSNALVYWMIGGASVSVLLIGVLVSILVFSGDDEERKNDQQLAENAGGDGKESSAPDSANKPNLAALPGSNPRGGKNGLADAGNNRIPPNRARNNRNRARPNIPDRRIAPDGPARSDSGGGGGA
ncbi:MAG: hypothetical protein IID45_10830, partial [Planctomycetes bacterium]|nr:hypothetical protein [Planctomycetota bacterium]